MLVSLVLAISMLFQGAPSFEQRAYDNGVVLFVDNNAGEITPLCSGSVIRKLSETYEILTAGHCVAHVTDGTVLLDGAKLWASRTIPPREAYLATVKRLGSLLHGEDYAILEIKVGDAFEGVPIFQLQETSLTIEDTVLVVGAPYGMGKLLLRGYVSEQARPMVYWRHVAKLQVPGVAPGSSGSAVYCRTTEKVCGVVVGLNNNGTVLAVPTEDIIDQ